MNKKYLVPTLISIIVLLLLQLSIVTALYLARSPVKTPQLAVGSLGTRITQNEEAVTVNGVRIDKNGAGQLAPLPGQHFVVVDLTLENLGQTPLQVAPLLNFHIKDSRGFVYSVTAVPSTHEMLSGNIASGDKLREEVGFTVDGSATGLRLYYESGRQSGGSAVIVDLER